MASKKPALGKKVNRATEVMNSPMGKAFMSAQGSDSGKAIGKAAGKKMNSGKGIVGEGKDVLKAAGNSVKQQAEFVGAVGKGAAKGAKAVAKGAEKVAGKVANITVGDVASAPKDVLKNIGKGAAKIGSLMYPEGNPTLRIPPMKKYQPKKVPLPKAPKPSRSSDGKKGPAAGGKPADRQYQGGSGSRKYPTNIPKGYTVLTLMSNPPKYKLVPKAEKKAKGK
jgi:hypothetical protein